MAGRPEKFESKTWPFAVRLEKKHYKILLRLAGRLDVRMSKADAFRALLDLADKRMRADENWPLSSKEGPRAADPAGQFLEQEAELDPEGAREAQERTSIPGGPEGPSSANGPGPLPSWMSAAGRAAARREARERVEDVGGPGGPPPSATGSESLSSSSAGSSSAPSSAPSSEEERHQETATH